jgi:hypothetical protein
MSMTINHKLLALRPETTTTEGACDDTNPIANTPPNPTPLTPLAKPEGTARRDLSAGGASAGTTARQFVLSVTPTSWGDVDGAEFMRLMENNDGFMRALWQEATMGSFSHQANLTGATKQADGVFLLDVEVSSSFGGGASRNTSLICQVDGTLSAPTFRFSRATSPEPIPTPVPAESTPELVKSTFDPKKRVELIDARAAIKAAQSEVSAVAKQIRALPDDTTLSFDKMIVWLANTATNLMNGDPASGGLAYGIDAETGRYVDAMTGHGLKGSGRPITRDEADAALSWCIDALEKVCNLYAVLLMTPGENGPMEASSLDEVLRQNMGFDADTRETLFTPEVLQKLMESQ